MFKALKQLNNRFKMKYLLHGNGSILKKPDFTLKQLHIYTTYSHRV